MEHPAVAVIGAGDMGSAMAKRLTDGGCSVVVSVEGRSAASRRRVEALGLASAETARDVVAHAELVLSIVPPGQAQTVAETFAAALRAAPKPIMYVDCNALAPVTVSDIETVVSTAGAGFLDAGIIGAPPRAGEPGPIIFVSGEQTAPMMQLRAAGLDVRVLGPSAGLSSALKMSYAGVTKGLTALYALMRQQARKNNLGAEYDAVLRETLPELAGYLERAASGMPPKAYRWIAGVSRRWLVVKRRIAPKGRQTKRRIAGTSGVSPGVLENIRFARFRPESRPGEIVYGLCQRAETVP